MKWVVNQYLKFKNRIAKINTIEKVNNDEIIKLRCLTLGQSYTYQQTILKSSLNKLYKDKKVSSINPEFILEMLAEVKRK